MVSMYVQVGCPRDLFQRVRLVWGHTLTSSRVKTRFWARDSWFCPSSISLTQSGSICQVPIGCPACWWVQEGVESMDKSFLVPLSQTAFCCRGLIYICRANLGEWAFGFLWFYTSLCTHTGRAVAAAALAMAPQVWL